MHWRCVWVAAALSGGCAREFQVPAEPGAPEVFGLRVAPPVARAGETLDIGFALSRPASGDPVVTLGGVSALKREGPGSDLSYLYGYRAAGTEPEAQDVLVRVEASGKTGTNTAVATVRFDFTPPGLDGAVTAAPLTAGANEAVTMQLVATEPLSALTVSLSGRESACAKASLSSPAAWSCTYTTDGTEREGPQEAEVTLVDAVGNAAALEVSAGVAFDFHSGAPPRILELAVKPPRARTGATLTVSFIADRALFEPPAVTVAGAEAARESGPDAAGAYAYRYTVTGDEPEGDQPVEVTAEDLNGRTGQASTTVRLDYTMPQLVSASAEPRAVRAGAEVVLSIEAGEPLRRVEASVLQTALSCAESTDPTRWTCRFTPSGTEPQGPQPVALALTDLAGNAGLATAEDAFVLDFACEADATRLLLRRGTGLGASFEAAPGAFEPGAHVALEDGEAAALAETAAAGDGSVAALAAGGGDRAEVYARATDAAGNACPPLRARAVYTATFAGKLAGASFPNASTLRFAVVADPAPPPSALEAAAEPEQPAYDAALAADAARAAVDAVTLATAPRWNPTLPGAYSSHGLAYDSARDRLVLFAGNTGATGLVNETFELAGDRWIRHEPAARPPKSFTQRLVYDSVRARTVLFGGAETWEWDGVSWTKKTPAHTPPARTGHAMAYDPLLAQTVLFGGSPTVTGAPLDLDTWTWDGADWTQHTGGAAPSARRNHAMARDPFPTGGGVLLFGGEQPVTFNTKFDDTWRWNGSAWSDVSGTLRPPARSHTAMAPDPVAKQVILFGGRPPGFNVQLDDTWIWDGTAWSTPAEVDSMPSARDSHAMAYDAARGRVVGYGGFGNSNFGDLFEWNPDGSTWDTRVPVVPPSDSGMSAAYDVARGRTLLVSAPSSASVETWLWDGASWAKATASPTPPARNGAAMVYDPRRQRSVLFGGVSGSAHYNDTWEWDGQAWTRPEPLEKPPGRKLHGMIFDRAAGMPMIFGGWNGLADLNDSWVWDGQAWTRLRLSVKPPRRQAPAFSYDAFRGRGLLFGGITGSTAFGDTWAWDGQSWLDADPDLFPPAMARPSSVYDSARRRVMLVDSSVWEFDGELWSALAGVQQGPGPFPRTAFTTSYDSARRRVVLMGGGGPPWELELPYAYPVALARFDVSLVPLRSPAAIQVQAIAAASGAGDTGASRPGVGLFLYDAADGAWIAAGSNAASDADPATARTLVFRAEGAEVARLLSGGVLRALLVPTHGASHRGASALRLDAVELTLEE